MPANLSFKDGTGVEAKNLQDTRIVTLEDTGGSIYTLDITTSDLKVAYTPQGSQKVEKTITGLATALGSLLSTKDNDKSVLVDTLGEFLDSSDKAKYDGKTDQTAKMFLGGKGLKGEKGADGKDGKDGEKGPQGEKGADGKDGKDGEKGPQGEKGEQGANGKSPSAAEIAAEIAADPVLQAHVAKTGIRSSEFREAIQEGMSQPKIFDIPSDPNAPISADW